MKISRLLGAVCACAITLISSASQAVSLQNGDILLFTTAAGSEASGIAAGATVFDSTNLDYFNGLIIGTAQPTIPGIDQTWTSNVAAVMGNHLTTSAVTVINDTTLDFSGWVMNIFGSDYAFGAQQGVATYSFDGTNFTLDYHWDASYNGNVGLGPLDVTLYDLHLAGTVVPVPAAVWLFGSGLVGLISITRRKKAT